MKKELLKTIDLSKLVELVGDFKRGIYFTDREAGDFYKYRGDGIFDRIKTYKKKNTKMGRCLRLRDKNNVSRCFYVSTLLIRILKKENMWKPTFKNYRVVINDISKPLSLNNLKLYKDNEGPSVLPYKKIKLP